MNIANQDQAEHWNTGDDLKHWVNDRARFDGMLAPFTDLILEGAQLTSTDHVLDVGCGCGATTLAAARIASRGSAVGVDLSAPMLEVARDDADRAGPGNATFEQADVQVHPFEDGAFDVVISRFGVMFFADPIGAFTNLRRATRPDGRLSFVCWQPLMANEWMTVPSAAMAEHVAFPEPPAPGAVGMFALADAERPAQILDEARWKDISVASRQLSILVGGPGTVDTAVNFLRSGALCRNVLASVDAETEARALEAVRAALAPFAVDDGVRLGSAVWLVTALA